MEHLAELGFEKINSGALYGTLRWLEKEGLCRSRWETPGDGPARRGYSVTNAGEGYLAAWVKGTEKYLQVLGPFSLAYARR